MSKTIRKSRDYSKGFIYELRCRDRRIPDIYGGSSINKAQRKSTHKSRCNNPKDPCYNFYVYQFIRAHGGWDNWELVVIKLYPCNSKMELEMEEQRMIDELGATLNSQRAWSGFEYGLSRQEYHKKYYQKDKDKIITRAKINYQERKEEIKTWKSTKIICFCGSTFTKSSKSRHEKTSEIHQHWLKTGEQKDLKGEQYQCGCGSTLTKGGKWQHEKTKGHQKWLASSSSKNDKK